MCEDPGVVGIQGSGGKVCGFEENVGTGCKDKVCGFEERTSEQGAHGGWI